MTAPPRLGTFTLLAACLVLDGFDVQAMGFAAPAIIQAWSIPPEALAPVFAAGLLGMFLGSLLAGMAADRLGRRPVLLAATLAFAACSLLTAAASSLPALVSIRLLAGLGLGAIMPNATALVGELSPPRQRVATMMIVTNGFLVGAMLGGFLSAWLIPAHGWRMVFIVGGLAPLALLAPLWRWLPETSQARVRPTKRPPELPLLRLFRRGGARATLLLWATNFLNVLTAYFVASWLPTVMRGLGHSTSNAVLAGTAVQAGGAVGTVVLGLVLRRLGFVPVLAACFAIAAAALAVIGRAGLPVPLLLVVAFVAGWCIFGGQPGLNALAATHYPEELRATGLGAALGVGRLGAILGPLVAAALLARGWSGEALFQAAAVPAALAAVVVVTMHRGLGSAPWDH